ncbi:ATP-grasp domain-containing protein [Ruminococcus gauvreauii]|uniref:ATP-grasp domain-containing protein n=1 Tax=Ruminococcus gauvreauii TaxID=438033 RepID=A0ABY5VD49_9FIRM|nr:ATP-grasp domain-containing protein [Ruminococcus gauvreauii]UWP58435.1 ATP-grasp domain-containing protein [Ruminococcus gauvreauii]
MKKRLMILGSLNEFTQLVKLAKERGICTVVCDGYPDSPAKQIADFAYDIDVRETVSLSRYARQHDVDAIITSFSDLLFECMVRSSDKAGLDCYLKPEQLPFYRNKMKMKQLLNSLSIATPRHVCLKRGFSDTELSELRFPAVTKPLDMYGSRGLYVLNSPAEVRRYFSRACSTSRVKEILVEEYNTGYEFNLMSWVMDGQVHILSIADREKTGTGTRDVPISTRNVYPSRLIGDVYEPAKNILEKFIAATGQTEGALSMQFFWAPGQAVEVCEIAGRFLGYEHELIEYSSGLSIEKLLLDSIYDRDALRKTLNEHSAFMAKHSAVLYFHSRPGYIGSQQTALEITEWPEVAESQLFYREGEAVVMHGPNPYFARYDITGKTRPYIDSVTQRIYDTMTVKDIRGKELLYRNEMPRYPENH